MLTYSERNCPIVHVHLSYFVDFILFPTDKYMFKVTNKEIRLIY